jgi:Tol biopolymer transport system component
MGSRSNAGAVRVAAMRTSPKPKLTAALLAIAALLALPAAANATLSYTKGIQKPRVFVAEDNGSGARQVGNGTNSHVSPNGEWIAYERESKGGASELRLYQVDIHKSERLLNPWAESSVFAWSPDSTKLAVVTGGTRGKRTLLVIEAKSMKREKVATGYFNGVSFSPESDEVVFGVSQTENTLKSDIFRYELGGTAAPRALTHGKVSAYPLWGPKEQIVFARYTPAKKPSESPAGQLFVMNPQGQRISQVTHTKLSPLSLGLIPTAWSRNGVRLLTEFAGEDQSYAVAVSTLTGAEKKLTKDPETGLQGAALSPDGSTVLGTVGLGFGGNPQPKVVTVPWGGGREKVLVPGGYLPSWGG